MQLIIDYIRKQYGLRISEVNSKSRKALTVECRRMTWFIIKELYKTKYSFAEIGSSCGLKDANTVHEGIKEIGNQLIFDKDLKNKKEKLVREVSKLFDIKEENQSYIEKIEELETKIKELENRLNKCEERVKKN